MLDVELLRAERRRFFVETRGGVYFPIAGAVVATARFTLLPLSIAVLYAVTSFWTLREVRRVEKDVTLR